MWLWGLAGLEEGVMDDIPPGAWGLGVDFLVAVRGGWVGMTIRLYPVTGALGVEVAEDPEFCVFRGLYGELLSRSARMLVSESISASRLERLSSRVFSGPFI